MKAMLMLEDGKIFQGESQGVEGERIGEVVFNTAVVGYQEMLTDPCNAGKILILTYPLIGNYGIAPKFNESEKCWVSGLVIKNKPGIYSNWQAKSSLDSFAREQDLIILSQIDTRTLTVHIRQKSEMLGIISTNTCRPAELLSKIKVYKEGGKGRDFIQSISVKKPLLVGRPRGKRIAVLDLGVTNSILGQLQMLGFSVQIFPYNYTAQDILKSKASGLIVSNGPENDLSFKEITDNLKGLIGKIPVLGIGTGHQALAYSLGAKINRMKVGHHGVNYPLYNPGFYKGEITSQNHSYVVDMDSLNKVRHIQITEFNLNDRSVEQMESKKLKLMGVQYLLPSPGCNEVNGILKKFTKNL